MLLSDRTPTANIDVNVLAIDVLAIDAWLRALSRLLQLWRHPFIVPEAVRGGSNFASVDQADRNSCWQRQYRDYPHNRHGGGTIVDLWWPMTTNQA